jgi:ABC-type glutathione transport system ATPase component
VSASPAVPLLEVQNLCVRYPTRQRDAPRAVDDVTFTIQPGETVGLVGESGSGKSSIGKAILGLVKIESGTLLLDGRPIMNPNLAMRRRLAHEVQVVFQDPYSSLNPVRTVGSSLIEPLLVGHGHTREAAWERARTMLGLVGLPADALTRYPAAFSGGQRQRIAIARALMMDARLIICDEPVSALDLSVQAQVLNLLVELQRNQGLSFLFISHDLSVVRHMSHHVLVLRKGEIVEQGSGREIWHRPAHPYTQKLIQSVPDPDPSKQRPLDIWAAAS